MIKRLAVIMVAAAMLGSCGEETPQEEIDRITQAIIERNTGSINLWVQTGEIPEIFQVLTPPLIALGCGERLRAMEKSEILDRAVRDAEIARLQNCQKTVQKNVFDRVNQAVHGSTN